MGDCIDQVFRLEPLYYAALWQGRIGGSAGYAYSWLGAMERLIDEGEITHPGSFVIMRLDRSLNPDAVPSLVWMGTVRDDMTVFEGLATSAPTMVHRWPPK